MATQEEDRGEFFVVWVSKIEKEGPCNVLSPVNFTPIPILDLERDFATSFNTQNFSWLFTNSLHKKMQAQ